MTFESSADRTDNATGSPLKRSARAARSPANRSRVGNGKALMAGADLRSADYREYRDIVADLVSHLGGDPSATQSAIIEEAAGLVFWCRRARLALVNGAEFDIGPYATATNALRRLLTDLGLERIAKDITPEVALRNHIARNHPRVAQDSPHDVAESDAIPDPNECASGFPIEEAAS
jgi:hypothetical protein